jgi:hypothetical protein
MSPGPTSIENPTFLATLQTILAVLEDDIAPLIPENTYLTLASQLQILYGIHNNSASGSGSGSGSGSVSYTYDNSANYFTGFGRLSGIVSNSNSNNSGSVSYTYDNSGNYFTGFGRMSGIVSNSNSNNSITNFTDALLIVERMYDAMSYVERERAYENNNYTNLMNTARNYWNAMSLDEQRDYRTNMRRDDIEFGGPVHRIIYPRA